MMESISKFGAKIGQQKHMIAIRDAFASTMPLIMAGSVAVLLNNVFFVPWSLTANFVGEKSAFITWTNEWIAPFFSSVDAGAFAILSLALAFSLGYNLANQYDVDPLSSGLVSVGAFFILNPLTRVSETAGYIGNYLGSQGVFVALFVGLVSAQIFIAITKKGYVIKMPELVPPAVGRAFAAIIPGAVALFSFAAVAYAFNMIPALAGEEVLIEETLTSTPTTIFNWVEQNITQVLTNLLSSNDGNWFIGGIIASIISFINAMFWSVGLHGANLLSPVMDGIYGPLAQENVQSFANNIEATHIWVRGSWDAYVFLGGSGTTLALLLAIMVGGKKEEEVEIAKLGLAPAAFQINEPVIFGLPIVLNPIYAIPFVISQPILTFVAYSANALGLVNPIVNIVPWTTPPIIGALMGTNFDWRAAVLAIVNLTIAFFIYLPFVRASNKAAQREVE